MVKGVVFRPQFCSADEVSKPCATCMYVFYRLSNIYIDILIWKTRIRVLFIARLHFVYMLYKHFFLYTVFKSLLRISTKIRNKFSAPFDALHQMFS